MPDSIVSAAYLVALFLGIGATLWKLWNWIIKKNIRRVINDKDVSEGMAKLSHALEEQGRKVGELENLTHKDDIRHAEMKAAVEGLADSIRDVELELKEMFKAIHRR